MAPAKKDDTKTVTFIEDVVVFDHNKEVEFEASVGEVKALAPASADRWIRRNKAVEGERVKSESQAEELRKVKEELEKAKERMTAAEADPGNTKEIELATKFLVGRHPVRLRRQVVGLVARGCAPGIRGRALDAGRRRCR